SKDGKDPSADLKAKVTWTCRDCDRSCLPVRDESQFFVGARQDPLTFRMVPFRCTGIETPAVSPGTVGTKD
ncbi:unnamed protein product, partial [Closterium sp. NIES-54]